MCQLAGMLAAPTVTQVETGDILRISTKEKAIAVGFKTYVHARISTYFPASADRCPIQQNSLNRSCISPEITTAVAHLRFRRGAFFILTGVELIFRVGP